MRNHKRRQNQAQSVNWRAIGDGLLLALIMLVIFVLLPALGGD